MLNGEENETRRIILFLNEKMVEKVENVFPHNHIFLRNDESLPMQSAISRITIYYLMSDEKNWCM